MTSFPQLRKDPIVDRWVLIAPERAARPFDLTGPPGSQLEAPCPFCEGQEDRTPPEVLAVRGSDARADGPGWQVRIVPNMFPAARRDAGPSSGDDLFQVASGYGVHEVVIESPSHETSLAALSTEQVRTLFAVFRHRLGDLAGDKQLRYVQIFKNHGPAAGASVEHVHSQILGVPRVPREVAAELAGAHAYHAHSRRCVYCELLDREVATRERLITAGDHCAAIAAYAGRFPYETWILPHHHSSGFLDATSAELNETADLIHTVVRRLSNHIENPSYNLLLHTAPLHDGPRADYHWHWELLPRTTGIAGFELSSGWYLNPLPPEVAASRLRG